MTRFNRYALAVIAVLLLAACGGDGGGADPGADDGDGTQTTAPPDDGATGTGTTATEDEGAAAGVTLATADSDLGTILVDGQGMTLYMFDNDSGGESSCYDACAETWPPLTGQATAEGDVDASLIGTTERTDGTIQVTYNGMPLYYYAPDEGPGDTTGQGVGDVWWVVGPDGEKITDANAAATSEGGGPYDDGY